MSNKTVNFHNGTGAGNETLLDQPNLCTLDTCELSMASFEYLPTIAGNSIYAGLFAIFIVGQLFFGIKHKTWGYMIAMIIGLLMEVGGYVARVLLHNSPFEDNFFLVYLICLTIAPAFLTAAIYLCLARIVTVYGEELSYFRPRTYTLIFCSCDLISLVLQGAGGGIASSADDQAGSDLGRNMMMAGLVFQVVSLAFFGLCCGDFSLRVLKNGGGANRKYLTLVNSLLFKSFLVGLFVACVTIFARSIYRCVELSGGFNSKLFIEDELLFMILEGVMIVLACGCLTFLHPAVCFQGAWHEANFNFRSKQSADAKMMRMSSDEESQRNIEMQSSPFIRK